MKKVGRYRWTIVGLAFLATTINYLDRQMISLLKDDYLEPIFGWSESDYANIVIAFQVAYAIGMVGSGYIIDRIGTRIGYALSLILWSLATMGHAFARTTLGMIGARGLLGISQAGNFPAAIKTVAEWFPKKERALAVGIFNSGTNVGAIIAPLTVPLLALHFGWKWAFIIPGALGFLWLILWFLIYRKPGEHPRLSQDELAYINADDDEPVETDQKVSWISLLGYRQTWSFAVLKFFSDPCWWFILFWLPSFLNKQYGMSQTDLAIPIATIYTIAMFGSIAGGWFSGFLIEKGWAVYRARRGVLLLFAVLQLSLMSAQFLGEFHPWYAILIIGFVASTHQAWSTNIFTTVTDMFPKKAVASVVGIGAMIGGVGSIIVARLAGLLLDHFQSLGQIEKGYFIMFIICSCMYLVAWSIFSLLVPKMKKVSL